MSNNPKKILEVSEHKKYELKKLISKINNINKQAGQIIGGNMVCILPSAQKQINECEGYIYFVTRKSRHCVIRPISSGYTNMAHETEDGLKYNTEVIPVDKSKVYYTFTENDIPSAYHADLGFDILEVTIQHPEHNQKMETKCLKGERRIVKSKKISKKRLKELERFVKEESVFNNNQIIYVEPELLFRTEQEVIDYIKKMYT
jgi:hypothetical protein